VTSKSRTTYNESVRRESTSLKRGILVSVRLCCIHWHMGKERRKEEFLPLCFWSVLDTTRKLVEKMGKRDASCALHGVFILLLLLFFSSVSVLFCSVLTTHALHCIMTRRGQSQTSLYRHVGTGEEEGRCCVYTYLLVLAFLAKRNTDVTLHILYNLNFTTFRSQSSWSLD
jgi:hypothetical protein